MTKYTIKVPRHFYDDHCDRELTLGQYETRDGIIKTTKTQYTVGLTEEDLLEVLSDACDCANWSWVEDDPCFRGRCISARATLRTVVAQLDAIGFNWDEHCGGDIYAQFRKTS